MHGKLEMVASAQLVNIFDNNDLHLATQNELKKIGRTFMLRNKYLRKSL